MVDNRSNFISFPRIDIENIISTVTAGDGADGHVLLECGVEMKFVPGDGEPVNKSEQIRVVSISESPCFLLRT